ncbi:MAG: GtrA family protein [Acidobacteriota bacterium]
MDDVHTLAPAHEASELKSRRTVFHRFAKFSAVGAGGVIVQTATLAVLLRVAGMHYLAATAVAVEASVLHNFVWHRRWTWADRPRSRTAVSLLRFNATNGATSLISNLAVMFILVGMLKVNPHAANLITIGICSLVNFALADRFVFI